MILFKRFARWGSGEDEKIEVWEELDGITIFGTDDEGVPSHVEVMKSEIPELIEVLIAAQEIIEERK